MLRIPHILLLLVICSISSCTPHSIREAHSVVAQADNTWRAGQPYHDSTALAQAYETLRQWQLLHSSEYVHACYHYGRLLREKDNPASAMQCFINATHSRTHDYHILGRVYSNMGSICHLASEYPLAYDMYERSAKIFMQNGDTLNYYYALNDMAYELAEQGKKDAAFNLILRIESTDNLYLYSKSTETKALAYLHTQQYDSAIYFAKEMYKFGKIEVAVLMICAQAYSLIGLKDSAVYYAKRVLEKPTSLNNRNNALYILTNDDETQSKTGIRATAADRSDTQKLLEIRQGKLSQAVQLLEQDIHRKPSRRWIYTLIAITLTFFSICIMYLTHRKHKRLQQQRADYSQRRNADLEISCASLRKSKNLKIELNWDNYDSMCSIVNTHLGGIAGKLNAFPDITPNDIRLCILVLLELSYEEIAVMLNLSSKSIAKLKSITAHKLGTTMKNLHDKLTQIACSDEER